MKSYSKEIRDIINSAEEGTIFVNSDFAKIADSDTIRKILSRLTQVGILRRIINGIFENLDIANY